MKKLVAIRTAADNCVLVNKTEEGNDQYVIILCNSIGTPVYSKTTEVEPIHVSMTKYHVVCASQSFVFVWQYRSFITEVKSVTGATSLLRKESVEKIFHIDEVVVTNEAKNDVSKKGTS